MVFSPNMQEIALQSEDDIREFRHIFGFHCVTFGSPNNFSGFLRKLREDSRFAVDFWVLTRAIRVREKGYITHEELFTLIVIAVAGPDLSSSNGSVTELLSEFNILLATRGENLRTERETRSAPLPSAVFPIKDDREAKKERTTDSRSNTAPTPPPHAQLPKRRNVALVVVFLSVTIAYVGMVIARHNQFERVGILGGASAHEKAVDRSESQSAVLSPAIVGDGSSNRGSGGRGSFGKYSMPTRTTNVTAEAHASEKIPELDTADHLPIHPVRRAVNFPNSKAPITSYAVGKSHRVGLSSGVMAANLLESHPPSYPRLASLARIQGSVVLQAIVSGRGTVESVHVIRGPYLLRRAASNAVLSWRYKPYALNGKPIEVATIVTVDFALKRQMR
jgi:TonB family protein